MRRVLAVSERILRALGHDRRSIALLVVAPILAITIFGYAFGTEPGNAPLAVVNLDTGNEGKAFVGALDPARVHVTTLGSWEEALLSVREGRYRGALLIPSNYSQNLECALRGGGCRVEVLLVLDGSNAPLAGAIERAVVEASKIALRSSTAPQIFSLRKSYEYGEGATFLDSFVPAVLGYFSFFFTTLLTLLSFVQERSSGTFERLRSTPLRPWELVFGYALGWGFVATLQGVLLLGVAVGVFGVLLKGSVLLSLFVLVLSAIDALSLGILFSALAKTERQAVQLLPFLVFPALLLSGIFVPVESLPSWLSPFSYLLPPTWGIDALRSVMIRGWGVEKIALHLGVLAGMAVLFLLAASRRIRS